MGNTTARWWAIALALLLGTRGTAQPAVELRGGIGYTLHRAKLYSLDGILDCGLLRSGHGEHWAGTASIRPWGAALPLEFGLLFAERGAVLQNSSTLPFRDSLSGQVVSASAAVELHSRWRFAELCVLGWLPLGERIELLGGLRGAIPLSAHYRQQERLIAPETLYFLLPDGRRSRSRELASGEIRSRNPVVLGGSIGIAHRLPLGGRLWWTQRLLAEFSLTSMVTPLPWHHWNLRLESGLRWELSAPPPPPSPQPAPPPVAQPSPPGLQLELADIRGRLRSGWELLATVPMVLAVFFEQNSAQLPSRYVLDTFPSPEQWNSLDAVEAHRYVLPFVAQLLARYPQAQLLIEASTSGEDEPGGIALAQQRAQSVAQALVRLGVPAERIRTQWSLLPRTPSSSVYPEGRAENRRAELILRNAPAMEYLYRQRLRRLEGTLEVQLHCTGIPETAALELWWSCSDTLLRLRSCSGRVQLPLGCQVPADATTLPIWIRGTVPAYGIATEAHATLELNQFPTDTLPLSLERFRAILRFDYNSAVLRPETEALLRELVQVLPPGSRLLIYGSSDALGTEQRNAELVEQRARTTAEFLRRLSPSLTLRTAPLPREWKFPESLPEGRFLNRSIWLVAE
jgi:outer membrane protein OmpA-like peptidoglycan-associated protein